MYSIGTYNTHIIFPTTDYILYCNIIAGTPIYYYRNVDIIFLKYYTRTQLLLYNGATV